MPSAGGICPPLIVALKGSNTGNKPTASKFSNNIDIDTYIEISTESPDCRLYFTVDGSKPQAHKEKFLSGRATFVYKGPFLMRKGKRVVKTVAVSRDGLKESDVVTKTFTVIDKSSHNNSNNSNNMINNNNNNNYNDINENYNTEVAVASYSDDLDNLLLTPNDVQLDTSLAMQQQQQQQQQPLTQINLWGHSNNNEELLNLLNNNNPRLNNNSMYNNNNAYNDPYNSNNNNNNTYNNPYNSNNNEQFIGRLGTMTSQALQSFGQPRVSLEELRAIIRDEGGRLLNNQLVLQQIQQQQMLQNIPRLHQQPFLQQNAQQRQWQQPPLQLRQAPQLLPQPQLLPPQQREREAGEAPEVVYVREGTPPLEACSPGNGDWKGQVTHLCGHVSNKVASSQALQEAFADYKFGKVKDIRVVGTDKRDEVEVRIIVKRVSGPLAPGAPLHAPMTFQKGGAVVKVASKLKNSFNQSYVGGRHGDYGEDGGKNKKKVKAKKKANEENIFASAFGGVFQRNKESDEDEEYEDGGFDDDASTRRDAFFESEQYQATGTVVASKNFDAEEDCKALKKAMKGFGTNEDEITRVLAHRSSVQRQELVQRFKTMYGQDLVEELEDELSGDYLSCCRALCTRPAYYDALCIRKAVKGAGTDEAVLIEVLCTRTNKQIRAINRAYQDLFNRDMQKDIQSDTSGHFRRLLTSQCQGRRQEGNDYDVTKVDEDVEALLRAGQQTWGTDESVFNSILCDRSEPHLRSLFNKYRQRSKGNKSMQATIADEFSGDIKKSLLAVVDAIEDKTGYFATRLQRAMKGAGTDDDALIRIIVSRCECDMVQIKEKFEEKFGKSLIDWIKGDTSGDYRKILVALTKGGE